MRHRAPNGASVIGRLVLIPMLFFAGQDSMRGPFPLAAPLLVLTGYAVLFGVLAMRFFRWE
jgi:hypothetical protein